MRRFFSVVVVLVALHASAQDVPADAATAPPTAAPLIDAGPSAQTPAQEAPTARRHKQKQGGEFGFEEPKRRLNRVTVGPLSIFLLKLSAEYERAVADKFSVAVGPSYVFAGAILDALGAGGGNTFGVALRGRWFPLERDLAPAGLWVGPELSGAIGEYTLSGLSTGFMTGSLLAMGGYTFIAEGGFTASGGLGLGVSYTDLETNIPEGAVAGFGLGVGLQLNVGWAF